MIRSFLFILGWTVITLLFGVLFLPALLSQRTTWYFSTLWAKLTLMWLRITCGIRSHVRGREHLKPGSIVASKHQSTWDTLMMWQAVGRPAFILKRELYFIPIFGWFLARGGNIAIDRKSGRDALRQISQQAPKIVAQGRTLVIFPEGTRVRTGQEKPFHRGVARISKELRLPVTPVALNAAKFWPKYTVSLRKSPGDAVLEFLPAMPPADGDDWLQQLQQAINTKTKELENA